MKEFEKGELSMESEENRTNKNIDGLLDYCDVCFIAFGSQEKRVILGEEVAHPDCAKKVMSKKAL
jgi:hypothetical protein